MCYVPMDLLMIVVLSIGFLLFIFEFRSVLVCSVLRCTKAVLPVETLTFFNEGTNLSCCKHKNFCSHNISWVKFLRG